MAATLDEVFRALADPTRRGILERLEEGEATVTELAEPFPMSLAGVSKHLRRLEAAGLVHRHVVGREHRIRLDPRPLRDAAAWVARYRAFWSERLRALEEFLAATAEEQAEEQAEVTDRAPRADPSRGRGDDESPTREEEP